LRENQDFWAWEEVDELVCRDPEAGWRVTHLLLNTASSDEALAYVAAGPLEDLMKKHGLTVIDQVAIAARNDKRLQLALSGVWINSSYAVWERWWELMKEFGFADGERKAL
jgi:hypothetical protein